MQPTHTFCWLEWSLCLCSSFFVCGSVSVFEVVVAVSERLKWWLLCLWAFAVVVIFEREIWLLV